MNKDRLLLIIKILGAAIPLGLLLISDKFLFPFVTPKAFIFRTLVELMCFFYIWLVIKDRNYLPRKSLLLAIVIVYFTMQFISGLTGVDWYRSWWGNLERMDGLATQLHYVLYFIVISATWKKREDWKYFLISSSVVGFILLIVGVLQRFGVNIYHLDSSSRVTGSFGNAAYFASYAIFNIFWAVILFYNQNKWDWKKYFFLAYLLLGISVLLFTETRGAIIGLAGGLTLFFILFNWLKEHSGQRKKWLIFAPIIILLLFVGSVYIFRDNSFLNKVAWFKRLTTISINASTAQSRLMVWDIAWQGWKQKPFLGWGWGQFEAIFNYNFNPAMYNQEPWFDHAHNVYLEVLSTTGIFGLLLYLSLFVCSLYYLWLAFKRGKISGVVLSAACGFAGAYFLQNAYIFDTVTSYIYFYSFLAFTLVVHSESVQTNIVETKYIGGWAKAILIFSFIFFLWVFNYFNILPIKANYYATQALRYSAVEKWSDLYLDLTTKALSYNTFGSQEIKYHLILNRLKSILDRPIEQVEKNTVQKFTILAEDEFKKSIIKEPAVLRSYVALTYVYLMNAKLNPDEVKEWSTKALEVVEAGRKLSPSKQDLLFLQSQAYLGLNDLPAAMGALDKAISLNESFFQPFVNYLKVATYASANDKIFWVLKELDESKVEMVPDFKIQFEELLNLAASKKNFPIVIEYYKRLIALDYNYARYHAGLAAAYAETGDYVKAREEASVAMSLDPNFAINGKLFIDSLRGKK